MCPKFFILKKFYFLILKSNVGHIINIYLNELLSKITKESRINESLRKKCFTIIKKKIDNLHFTFNNILQNLLKS